MRKTSTYARKRSHCYVSPLLSNQVMSAYAPKVMRTAQQTELALAARTAFEAFQCGSGSEDERDILAGTANLVMVLAEKHCAQDDLDAAVAAQEALLRADCRAADGKSWNFDAVGRLAIIDMLDAHEQMLATFGHAALTDALCTVMGRRARGRMHRIERISA